MDTATLAPSQTDRAAHLAWCKARALAYLPANPTNALASMFSDLGKSPTTAGHIGIEFGAGLMFAGLLATPTQVREFIEGFN